MSDAMSMEWCTTIAENVGADYLRDVRDEWDARAFGGGEVRSLFAVNLAWRPWESEIEDDVGARIMLGLLREAHEADGEDTQALLWLRMVQGDGWAETGNEPGIRHTAAKRCFQRMQDGIRRAVQKKLVALAPDELTMAERWIARRDLSDAEMMTVPPTRSVRHADA